jgi:aminoglycoside phosphotransferase family enzyme/predicted kinase
MTVEDQTSVLAFLTDPTSYGRLATQLLRITTTDTHISVIVFVGPRVFKLKRAVHLPYVDFSTADRRLAACLKELELNRRTAPMLYVGVRRITREADGSLLFDGRGELADAVVEMVRFDEDTLFDRMATRGQLTSALLTELSRILARFHADAAIDRRQTGAARIASVLDANERALATTDTFARDKIAALTAGFWAAMGRHEALLNARERAGKVRHCHGDLHLRNICLVEGVPTLFDCIEFDEGIATIDVLYDLAFVLMDLWHHGFKSGANLVFNRYFDECDETDGLPLMSFFMALRATIRAHVIDTQARQAVKQRREELVREAKAYIALAFQFLASAPPRLVAIGGLSGTGKSTVAAAVADQVGSAPGARVLASDRIRKGLHGVPAEVRLSAKAYLPEVSRQVYATLMREAKTTLANGHAVIADAVFDRVADRERIEQVALSLEAPFAGIWLYTQPDTLFARVDARRGDASDATVEVVRAQLASVNGPVNWVWIETGGGIAATVARVTKALAGEVP